MGGPTNHSGGAASHIRESSSETDPVSGTSGLLCQG